MPDAAFDDPDLAALYDRANGDADSADHRFYLRLMQVAGSVLDVGCGTGALLHRARQAGHPGRLVGIDPAVGMLAQARRHPDVDWVLGALPDAGYRGEFDLLVMTGHAFQVLQTDDDLREFLSAARTALRPGGRFAFETRNPLVRPWERWTPEHGVEFAGDGGVTVRTWHELRAVDAAHVTFDEFFAADSWGRPRVSTSTLRFIRVEVLDGLLRDAGLSVAARYGDWDASLFTADSPEIITVASRS